MSRIVVGVDGSESSKAALRWAARFLQVTGGWIDAVIAWHPPANYGFSYLPGDWNPEKDAETVLSRAVDEVFGTDRPAGMRLIVREGNPAKVLLDESNDADLLVVGSRGHGGFAGLLLGSVSAHCAEHATLPVLVVHDNNDGEAQ
jgi:nucleotide-binding universal stress UspA family protein